MPFPIKIIPIAFDWFACRCLAVVLERVLFKKMISDIDRISQNSEKNTRVLQCLSFCVVAIGFR